MPDTGHDLLGRCRVLAKAVDKTVTVYTNGVAYVECQIVGDSDITAAPIIARAEGNVYAIRNVSPEINIASLHPLSRGVMFSKAQFHPAMTIAQIAKENIGKEVIVSDNTYRIAGTERINREDVPVSRSAQYTYFLLGVEGDNAIVGYENQVEVVKLDRVMLKGEFDRHCPFLEVETCAASSKKRSLDFGYLTSGITLTPNYNIVLENGKLRMTYGFEIDNHSGKKYSDVELVLIPGDVGVPHFEHGMAPLKGIRRLVAGADTIDELCCMSMEVEALEEAGQIGFRIRQYDIPEGESKVDLFTTRPLRCRIGYDAVLHGQKPQITTTLRWRAPITLPRGAVGVYSEGTEWGYEGGSELPATLKGHEVRVGLRTPDTLKIEHKPASQAKIVPSGIERVLSLSRKYAVSARNAGKEDVTVDVALPLGYADKICDLTLKPKVAKGMARWSLVIKAGKSAGFNYTINKPQLIAVPESELKAMMSRGRDINMLQLTLPSEEGD